MRTSLPPSKLQPSRMMKRTFWPTFNLWQAGEGNAQLIIDGFEGGRLPRRDQIAQIVIEPNSFNATGTGPRITIVYKGAGTEGAMDRQRELYVSRFPTECRNTPSIKQTR